MNEKQCEQHVKAMRFTGHPQASECEQYLSGDSKGCDACKPPPTLVVKNPYRDSGRTPAYHESVIEAATTTAHLAFNEGVKADRTAVVAWLEGKRDNGPLHKEVCMTGWYPNRGGRHWVYDNTCEYCHCDSLIAELEEQG